MNRNVLYAIIAVLVVAIAVLGYTYYQDQQSTRVEINLDENGLSVEGG